MQGRIESAGWRPLRSASRGLAWLGGALALAAASAVGAILALIFATTVVVISFMAVVVLALTGAALRARRSMREASDPNVIEARHMGGHSWVAYGWDGRR